MLWLTLQQLKSGTASTRRKAARELWREPNSRALAALARAAVKDRDSEVRQLAAAALGRLQDPGRYEPLMQALSDRDAEVVRCALLGLRRAADDRVIGALVPLLRHADAGVRHSAAQTIDTIRWVPRDREERVWFQVAKGWYERAAAAGAEALPALQLTIKTGPVSNAVRAVGALAMIPDPQIVKLLCAALEAEEIGVRIAAADALGKVGGSEAVAALAPCLRSPHTQVRVAAVQALGILHAAETTKEVCRLLEDAEWEVRQEAAVALGRLNNPEAVEPLIAALDDLDTDVRESAAMALGKIGDRRAVAPLVLTLKDEIAAVRRISAAALARIDPDWVSLPETRTTAETLKQAIEDADPAIRFFVAQLLVNLGEIKPEDAGGTAPEDHLASPAIKRKRMATNLFVGLLQDPDPNVRQAAAEALARLGGERARQALTRTASDPDGDVAAATQMALQALSTGTPA